MGIPVFADSVMHIRTLFTCLICRARINLYKGKDVVSALLDSWHLMCNRCVTEIHYFLASCLKQAKIYWQRHAQILSAWWFLWNVYTQCIQTVTKIENIFIASKCSLMFLPGQSFQESQLPLNLYHQRWDWVLYSLYSLASDFLCYT